MSSLVQIANCGYPVDNKSTTKKTPFKGSFSGTYFPKAIKD